MPDASSLDRLTIKVFAVFKFFCLFLTVPFRTVANRLALPEALERPTKLTFFLSADMVT